MTNKIKTRNALFTSIISLLLCVSMLVGTTFAWFTDEVKSGTNVITAGNLDVELYHGKTTTPTSKVDANTKLFTDTKSTEIELWEPGVVAYTNLMVANEGNLALKYQMALTFTNANTVGGKSLADVLKVSLIPGGVQGSTREAVLAEAQRGTVGSLQDFKKSGKLEKDTDSDVFGLVVYWPDNNSNEFDNQFNLNNGKFADDQSTALKIDLGVTLFATQLQYEEDSFGSDYDENIWQDAMFVASEEDLVSAIAAGETAIMLEDDIALTEALEIPANTNLALNLNGKTLSSNVGTDEEGNRVHVLKNLGSLTLVGGTVSSNGTNGGSAVYNEGTATIEGTKFNGAPFGSSGNPSYVFNNNGGTMTISNAEIEAQHGVFCAYNNGVTTVNNTTATMGLNGKTHHVFYTYDGGAITVNGGTYTNKATDQNSTGGSCINGAVTTNAGTFNGRLENYYDKPVLQGGTFSVNPNASFIAAGYKAVENNGKYVVVPEDTDSVVTTAADLAAAIAQGGVVSVMADIDAGNSWTSVKPNGELTILGNDNTITNLNLPLLTGGVSSKVTIKGLTIADSNVAPAAYENGLGSGAFIPYVDAYGDVTFEKCHLLNTTVTGNERAGGFVGYSSGQSVTIKDSTVEGCTITAVGGAGGLVGYSQSVTVIENSSVKNTKLTATEDRLGTKAALAGAVIGTVNGDTTLTKVTVSGNTVSNNNALPVYNDCIGRKVAGTLVVDGKTAASSAADIAAGGEFVLTGNIETSSDFNSNTTIDLSKNTLTLTNSDQTVSGNLTVTNGTVDSTKGYFDLRPNGDSETVFEGVVFENTALKKTSGTSTNHVVSAFETTPLVSGATMKLTFKKCTFNNTNAVFEAMSSAGDLKIEAVFEECTFNLFGNCSAIEIQNYITANITIKDCNFNITATSGTGIVDSMSGSTVNVTFVGENVLNGIAAVATDASVAGTVNEVKTHNPAVKVAATSWAIDTLNGKDTITCQGIATK